MPPKKHAKKETAEQRRKREQREAIEASRKQAAEESKAAAEANGDGGEDGNEVKQPEKPKHEDYRSATGVLESQPYSRDIKIGGFTLQSYGRELIQDTTIELTLGRRYGLIGSNGSGKSSFMKCLAAREVPIPGHIDIFLLEHEVEPSNETPVEVVIAVVKNEQERLEKLAEQLVEELGPESEAVLNVYGRLDELDPSTFETRATLLLRGLGFSLEMMAKKTKDLSGGWRMRVSLARALFVKPMLLLLDEPTNHLDLEACVWLENYLARYDQCLVVVSHSQDFLNGVCTNIIDLTPKAKLMYYTGNYDTYVKTKEEMEVNQMKHYTKEQEDIKHIKQFIASCGTFSNLVRQAKSKQKILDKMYAAGLTEKVVPLPKFRFDFAACEKLPPPVLAFIDVAFAYSGKKADYLYEHVNLGADMDSRIALVGPNGAGKSTLLKLMVGELMPSEGDVRRNLHLNFARYHQHSAEALDRNKTVLDYFMDKYPERKMPVEEWRQHVGRYGVSGNYQTAKIGTLSDGIQSRVVFAEMSLGNPNMLLLDEPTNHLDMQCIDSLATAINNFQGGLILVSHDFRLIDQVAKEIWVCDNRTVKVWKGDIRSYKAWIKRNMPET